MPLIREEAVERMHRDHDVLVELVHRIKASCTRAPSIANCDQCALSHRQVCHGNIEQLVKSFVEATLKHNMIESLLMEQGVPQGHRVAHNKAHMALAEQLRSIRVIFSEDGNCVLAIEGIDRVLANLLAHFAEFDRELEQYLMAAA